MVTKPELEARLREALRAGDEVPKRTLRMALLAIKLAEVETGGELDSQQILDIFRKEARTRRESLAEAQRAGRQDLAEAAQAELAYLQEFLPSPLSESELTELASQAIEATGATSPDAMGLVMKELMPKIQDRADGRTVVEIVRRLLSDS